MPKHLTHSGALLLLVLAAAPGAGVAQADAAVVAGDPVVAEVRARDEALARAHGSGDMATYLAGLSDRYAYIDVGGQRVTAQRLQARRADDQRRLLWSETAEQEALRLSDDVVLLRGVERSRATYYGGLPRRGASRWSALWVREEDGVWRLVAETATPVRDELAVKPQAVPQPPAVLAGHAGRWQLDLSPPLVLELVAADQALVGSLPGQAVRFTFRPASADHYIADERPFELRFAADDTLVVTTWGTPTQAVRVDPARASAPGSSGADATR